jgi:site-specific recombinase XerD
MTWQYWIALFTNTHCTARGLRTSTIRAYEADLMHFHIYIQVRYNDIGPHEITARHVLEYLDYLRTERNNGHAAVNRQLTVLRVFYKAMVAMGYLETDHNPLAHFPKIKSTPRKLPVTLSEDEIERLLDAPPRDTVLGLRDRAILALLYGTGIRASECAHLTVDDVDLGNATVHVVGKGGHERTVPLNDAVVEALVRYVQARGEVPPAGPFFVSRSKRAMSRGAVYERVRTWGQRAELTRRVSPHRLRHTFATHLVRAGVGIVTIRDLLGHRCITSTQVYLHVTARELEEAAGLHPIYHLAPIVEDLLPDVKLPFQRPTFRRRSG